MRLQSKIRRLEEMTGKQKEIARQRVEASR
jgi:hypothetical protein